MRRSGLDVLYHLGVVQLHAVVTALGDVVRRVAELNAALDAIEEGGRDGQVAGGGETIRHVTHVVVDAKDLLYDDQAGLGGRGSRGVGGQRKPVGSLQRDGATHDTSPVVCAVRGGQDAGMGEIVNLRSVKKRLGREAAKQDAKETRVRHGRTKAEAANDRRAEARRAAVLDGSRRGETGE